MTILAQLLAQATTEKQDSQAKSPSELQPGDYDQLDYAELNNDIRQDKFMKDTLAKGLDIASSMKSIQQELSTLENGFITESAVYAEPLLELHQDLKSVDSLLNDMENILTGFKDDLSKLSDEISQIQGLSSEMRTRVSNRSAVEGRLHTILEALFVAPDLIRTVFSDEPIDHVFMAHVKELHDKIMFIKRPEYTKIRAAREVGPAIEGLRLKAGEKIRTYFMSKVSALIVPNANIAITQQSAFLNYRFLYHFLTWHFPDYAAEVQINYLHIMSNYYTSRFAKYIARVQKLQTFVADKSDLIGAEDASKKSLFGVARAPTAMKEKASFFALGERAETLYEAEDSSVILPHVSEENGTKHSFESIFRSVTRTLMDNASSEYVFAIEFFVAPPLKDGKTVKGSPAKSSPGHIANEVFGEIFFKTLKVVSDFVKSSIEGNVDALGLLLCIRITMKHQMMMQTRKVPCLDNFLNSLLLAFWPKFQAAFEMHINSVKASGTGNGLFSTIDIHPHIITRRYGEFASSLLVLNDGHQEQLLEISLNRLRAEVENLLEKMGAEIPGDQRKLIFFINNYDLLVSILETTNTPGVVGEKNHFQELLDAKIVAFVEDQVLPKFTKLIGFVERTESVPDIQSIPVESFESIARVFNDMWKQALADINSLMMQSFSNFKTGSVVLHIALKRIIFKYQQFVMLW
eukprot:Partr_v1_DN28738_c2_g1_i4_m62168 putative vacuolar protein sorting 52 homolog (S. cerevisiae)